MLKANEILMNNKLVEEVSAVELEKILLMHQIPKSKTGNKHNKLVKWKEILQSNKHPHSFKIWSSEDEAHLNNLRKMDIKLEDTQLGGQATVKKL